MATEPGQVAEAATAEAAPPRHTPGPWRAGPAGDWNMIFGVDGWHVCRVSNFCGARDYTDSRAESMANAALIAESPNLLGMLKAMVEAVRLEVLVPGPTAVQSGDEMTPPSSPFTPRPKITSDAGLATSCCGAGGGRAGSTLFPLADAVTTTSSERYGPRPRRPVADPANNSPRRSSTIVHHHPTQQQAEAALRLLAQAEAGNVGFDSQDLLHKLEEEAVFAALDAPLVIGQGDSAVHVPLDGSGGEPLGKVMVGLIVGILIVALVGGAVAGMLNL